MRRVFTQNVGRYKSGEVRDWPRSTWDTFFDGSSETKPDWKKVTADPEETIQKAFGASPKTAREVVANKAGSKANLKEKAA